MKSRAHIYMANLLMDEINKNGYVTIGDTDYAVPKKICEVIKMYPDYFRAGAVGPDFFPDLIIGQMDIHPKNSNKFLELMYNELTTMPQGESYNQAFAFYLGFSIHYAGDMFSHYYINKYAGGYFPNFNEVFDIKNFPTIITYSDPLSVILKHITIESYLDKKVAKQNFTIQIPINFLKRCFGTPEAWKKIDKILGPDRNKDIEFLRLMVNEYSNALKKDKLKSQELQAKITQWMNEWQKFAVNCIQGKDFNFKEISSIIKTIKTDTIYIKLLQFCIYIYEYKNSPAPLIFDILTGEILNPINLVEKGVELAFYKALLKGLYKSLNEKKTPPNTLDACEKELRNVLFNFFTEPAKVLNEYNLFKPLRTETKCSKLTDYFDKEWGNFGKAKDCASQNFKVFRQCLNMGKLCLLGNNNLIKIAEDYKATNYLNKFKDGEFNYSISKVKVYVKVSDEFAAGTDYDVHLISVTNKSKKQYCLDRLGNDFERGSTRIYEVNLNEKIKLEELKEFQISVDYKLSSQKFIVSKVEITDIDSQIKLAEINKRTVIKKDAPLILQVNTNALLKKYKG
ncbi:zinc dependent phospholipase C family protein [Treponema bryantii]|uniref:zinc dependent phospholipase C family protein n=1 Tax=Treponema bryantii TaxID=163 RepID=UPI002B2EA0A9|nr:hypothetical protein TRBR_05410 [Treponema bryantii]